MYRLHTEEKQQVCPVQGTWHLASYIMLSAVFLKQASCVQLTELSLTTDAFSERWLGTEKADDRWLGLSSLQKLTLSGHSHFWRIPSDFAKLPLTYLDLSLSKVADFSALRTITGLQVLSLQVTTLLCYRNNLGAWCHKSSFISPLLLTSWWNAWAWIVLFFIKLLSWLWSRACAFCVWFLLTQG